MGGNPQRRKLVQQLRQRARGHSVPLVPDNASKAAVDAMVDAVLGIPNMPDDERAAILQTKAEFDNTWASASASGAQQDAHAPDATSTKVWKFTAAQLTYNATEGEWASTNKQELRGLFDRVLTFARVLEKSLKAEHLSVKMERSKENHVHIHVYFNLTKAFRAEGPSALAPFTFEGIHPHVVPNKASGGAFAGAVRHGHFYVVADKIGSVFAWTNYHPFTDYAVEGWWLDNLLKQQKMTHEAYLSNAARLGVGFQRRLNDVSAAQRYLKGQAIAQAVQVQADALKEHTFPMKDFPEVDDFLACFQGPRHRRPVLAIIGGTNLGKSMLAAHVLRKLGSMLGLANFVEVTVEQNPHLDLADFDWTRDAGVLLDGVGDSLILKQNREALQGRAKLCKGGQSATNVYSYTYSLVKRGAVATFDLSAENLMLFHTDHWLSNKQNVITLYLKEKAFAEGPTTPRAAAVAPQGSPQTRMAKRRFVGKCPGHHDVVEFPPRS